ncbi:ATP-dependent nuclease [Burkholderia pseudomallei]|uniref:Putative ATP binding protein n=3 Tax=Burkholderia pseudomallei TaxID=28450 RepID=A0A0H3HTA5_BURP2|nr:AAA family ATPase [Burkholderia pseudomallei]AFI67528.1 putative ATP binding protein [Burkholderia pseudomallei 1026b]AIP13835.1 AAA ATPase domain protein [Burkholderia pseudomallei]AIV85738.1 AAA domain protein [Burkholderia pseudomallei MSHR3965]AJX08366.1 AAA ATPase domain protein [Burkholderia pseudomallei 1026b]AJX79161.1 AAA domain protein [Burkholderia pseudomallei MSHR2543]
MPNTIEINNLKHIHTLAFEVPPPGVHLLSGSNGAGKTSVLACLRRIGHPNAFAQHFRPSQISDALDSFDGAEIVYTVNGRRVTYAYAGERWVPRPRSANRLLQNFGYPTVVYVGATADRITPRPEDFRPARIRPAPQVLRDAANEILETNKFDALKVINLTPGGGNPAFVLQTKAPPQAKYVSERNLSLGELCVMKLIRSLLTCANNSLILIDELELALHPRAQIGLLRYLQTIAQDKQLTIIFSTHSVSLLKRVPRDRIIFLEADDGNVSAIKGCFPTYALGNIAYDEERGPDLVIYVEDEAALYATEALTQLAIGHRFRNDESLFPTVHVIPIGPFMSVVRFLDRSRALLPISCTSVALLDRDVKDETIANWEAERNHVALAEFQRHEQTIDYLPWTPEVAFVDFLRNHRQTALRLIQQYFHNVHLNYGNADIGDIPAAAGSEQRNRCKTAFRNVVARIAGALPNDSEADVRKALIRLFAQWYWDNERAAVLQLVGPHLAAAMRRQQ